MIYVHDIDHGKNARRVLPTSRWFIGVVEYEYSVKLTKGEDLILFSGFRGAFLKTTLNLKESGCLHVIPCRNILENILECGQED